MQVLTNSDNQALYQQNPSNVGLDNMKTVLTNNPQSNLDQKVCDLEKQLNSEKEKSCQILKQCDILKGEKEVLAEQVRLSTRIWILYINTDEKKSCEPLFLKWCLFTLQIEKNRIESEDASERYNALSCEKNALEEELANTRQKLDEALKVIKDSKT